MTVESTAYTLVEYGDEMGGSGLTSTGTVPTAGRTIAVDPSVIPYGSKVKINGNIYIAEDCGGAIKGNIIDIYMSSLAECTNWGRRTIQIEVQR